MECTTTLWQLLQQQNVVVPIIQRDYAQGRKGKEYIRKTFLAEIKKHIDLNKRLTLDFVYGNNEINVFQPLDGQQRLTTLWLTHWYIALKSGKLSEAKKVLGKFSYHTRVSSTEFCSSLCNEGNFEEFKGNISVAEYIKSQTWFYSAWLLDPTIGAMLRTISGDTTELELDNIEAVFKDSDYGEVWKSLTEENIISFEKLVIGTDKLPISDDLYIKMNARGKKLTDFENFKADLISWVQRDNDFKQLNENGEEYCQYFSKRIDNDWTDVFWEHARNDLGESFNGRIDDSYFSFFNRYVLNKVCFNKDLPSRFDSNAVSDEAKIAIQEFNKLYGIGYQKETDDTIINYEGFEIYKKFISLSDFKKIDNILSALSKKEIRESVGNALSFKDLDIDEAESKDLTIDKCSFIPKYISEANNKISIAKITLKGRIYFLAICRYLENYNGIFNSKSFSRWMRIVKNITENASVDSIPAMITCLKFIYNLSVYMENGDWQIYELLRDYDGDTTNVEQLKNQLLEEKEKARKICEEPDLWEPLLTKAENHSFFNGTIRFLFYNNDWDNFENRFQKAQELFNNANVVSEDVVERFLELYDDFKEKQYFFTTIGYHNRYKCWKKDILCSQDMDVLEKVEMLLMEISPSHSKEPMYEKFLSSGIVKYICSRPYNYKYRYHWFNNKWSVHRKDSSSECVYIKYSENEEAQTQVLLDNNKVLKNLKEKNIITLSSSNAIFGEFIWGAEIIFDYKDKTYCCDRDGNLKIQKDDELIESDLTWEGLRQLSQ